LFQPEKFHQKRPVIKAELLQLNCTQFPSLGIFFSKKDGNRKTNATFTISVFKIVHQVVLVFWISNFFINKNSQGRKIEFKKKYLRNSGNSALESNKFR
jgi:hypothetical protein